MAHYAYDNLGGQQGPHLDFQPQWLPETTSYLSSAPTESWNTTQAILTENDTTFMQNFFSNPDSNLVDDSSFFFTWSDMDQKPGGSELNRHLNGFGAPSQSLQDSTGTLPDPTAHDYGRRLTSNNQQPNSSSSLVNFHNNLPGQTADEDDVNAASTLNSMLMNTQAARGSTNFNGAAGGSWGNLDNRNSLLNIQRPDMSPLTSSGRQSANSYHSQPKNTLHSRQRMMQNEQTNPAVMQQYLWQQQQQQMQAVGTSRMPHASTMIDRPGYNFYPHQQAQARFHNPATLPDQVSTRPSAVRFGSDSDFSSYGYRGSAAQMPIEQQKGANLNNVPFAAQAAANRSLPMQSFAPMSSPRTLEQYSAQHRPHSTYNSSSMLAGSSLDTLGGLPVNTYNSNDMMSTHRHGHPVRSIAQRIANDGEEVDPAESPYQQQRPRKRRRSEVEHDDDAAYAPVSQLKTPSSKRGKLAKAVVTIDSDDEYDEDYEEGPTAGSRSSTKHRKSSTNKRLSLESSPYDSPAGITSPSGRPGSSSKKKSRIAASRQNLTEDEKRRNHILSEKTRRDLIRTQYDSLDTLVPALKEGKSGLSRSDILKEITTYVQGVANGNKSMMDVLEQGAKAAAGATTGGFG